MWVRFGLCYSYLFFVSSHSLFFFPIVHVFHTSTPYFFSHLRWTLFVGNFPRKLSVGNFPWIISEKFSVGNFYEHYLSEISHENFPSKNLHGLFLMDFPLEISDGLQKIRRLKFPMTFSPTDFCPSEIDR